ncbi:MAG TPA: ArdC family protein [Solirubrobacterales bacterium]|nr:ArdC family protein [Solirubrobacterales bacterium]
MNSKFTITTHAASGHLLRREETDVHDEAVFSFAAAVDLLSGRGHNPSQFRDLAAEKLAEVLAELDRGAVIGRALHVDGNGSVALECRASAADADGRAAPPDFGAAAPRFWEASSPPIGGGPPRGGQMSTKSRSRKSRRVLSEGERAKKREAERRLMAEAVDGLRGSEGWRRWIRVRSKFRTYSLTNQLLIAWQMPEATKVAGFRKWLDLGYAVRKGEKAIYIWAPCPPSKKKLKKWREDGADPDERPRMFFRMVAVFDRSQVDPLPNCPNVVDLSPPPIQPVDGDGLADLLPTLQAFAASIGFSFEIGPTPAGANGYCTPARKAIVVRAVAADFSPNAQVETGVHECSHALLRAEREEDDPTLSYDEEEIVVACVSYSVCRSLGLDTSGSNTAYIASWGEGEQIERYAGLIDRLARRIESAIRPEATAGATLEQPVTELAAA